VTEIPEHLLKRSQARRAALSGGDAPAEDGAPAEDAPSTAVDKPAAAPAAAAAAPVAPAAPPPPKPDPPYVAAAKRRRKVPYWAMPVIALLPVWAIVYYNAVQSPPAGADDPLTIGQQVYSANCAACHGATGGGGTGPALDNGDATTTFPNPYEMVHWIAFGAKEGARPDGTYGDPKRSGGAHRLSTFPAAMPGWKDSLSTEELAAVTMYVRQVIDEADPASKEEAGFNVDNFDTLPDNVQAVIDLGPGGDPDVSKIGGK
jgi:mono/diheme cytochrome c family protein